MDFALNPNPFGKGRQEMRVSQRLIVNYFTAKRLLGALQMTVQRHEGAFGSLELDVHRRQRAVAEKRGCRSGSKPTAGWQDRW